MKRKIFLFDVDGVVIKDRYFIWGNRYLANIGKPTFGSVTQLDPQKPNALWAMFNTEQEITHFLCWLIKHDTYKDIPPVEGAIDSLKRLSNYGDVILASRCLPKTISRISFEAALREAPEKRRWIARNIPFVPQENFIDICRKDVLRGYSMTDDSLENIGGQFKRKILFDTWFNNKATNEQLQKLRAIRAKGWNEVLENLI
jgi:5'(3')-deoxyribonucleotidase